MDRRYYAAEGCRLSPPGARFPRYAMPTRMLARRRRARLFVSPAARHYALTGARHALASERRFLELHHFPRMLIRCRRPNVGFDDHPSSARL